MARPPSGEAKSPAPRHGPCVDSAEPSKVKSLTTIGPRFARATRTSAWRARIWANSSRLAPGGARCGPISTTGASNSTSSSRSLPPIRLARPNSNRIDGPLSHGAPRGPISTSAISRNGVGKMRSVIGPDIRTGVPMRTAMARATSSRRADQSTRGGATSAVTSAVTSATATKVRRFRKASEKPKRGRCGVFGEFGGCVTRRRRDQCPPANIAGAAAQ